MLVESDRRIFGPYFNGVGPVYADPMTIRRRLYYYLDGDPNKVIRDTRAEDPALRFQAKERLVAAAREAFEMIPWDAQAGRGALEVDVMKALKDYLVWLEKKDEQVPNLPTWSQPTAPEFSPLSPAASYPNYPLPLDTISGSASGCTSDGPCGVSRGQ